MRRLSCIAWWRGSWWIDLEERKKPEVKGKFVVVFEKKVPSLGLYRKSPIKSFHHELIPSYSEFDDGEDSAKWFICRSGSRAVSLMVIQF